jgi:hypothetical protein
MLGFVAFLIGLGGCASRPPSKAASQEAALAMPSSALSASPSVAAPAPEEHHYQVDLARVSGVDVLGQVGPEAVALPVYPHASVQATRQVRLHFRDGQVLRQIEVVLSTPDRSDTITSWYQTRGRMAYKADTPTSDTSDYRIWVRDDPAGDRRITLLRFMSD